MRSSSPFVLSPVSSVEERWISALECISRNDSDGCAVALQVTDWIKKSPSEISLLMFCVPRFVIIDFNYSDGRFSHCGGIAPLVLLCCTTQLFLMPLHVQASYLRWKANCTFSFFDVKANKFRSIGPTCIHATTQLDFLRMIWQCCATGAQVFCLVFALTCCHQPRGGSYLLSNLCTGNTIRHCHFAFHYSFSARATCS